MVTIVGALLVIVIPSILDTFSNSRLYARNIWDQTLANTLAVSHVDAFLAYYNRYTGDASDVTVSGTNYVHAYAYCGVERNYTLHGGKKVVLKLDCEEKSNQNNPNKVDEFTIKGYAKVGKEEAAKTFKIEPSLKGSTQVSSDITIQSGSIDRIPIGNDTPQTVSFATFNIQQYENDYRLWYDVYNYALTEGYTFRSDGLGIEGSDGGKARSVSGTLRVLVPYSSFQKPVTEVSFANVIVWLNAFSARGNRTPVYVDSLKNVITDANQVTSFSDVYVNKIADGYKLPTEQQWEIAARWVGQLSTSCPDVNTQIQSEDATTGNRFCWTKSDQIAGATASDGVSKRAWYSINANGKAQPTGKLESTAIALFDMSGNVAEMVVSMNGDHIDNVYARGGSWKTETIDELKVNNQGTKIDSVNKSFNDVGFRMVRN
jgi:formylglycine-generating enzyme required for sulfatase activity